MPHPFGRRVVALMATGALILLAVACGAAPQIGAVSPPAPPTTAPYSSPVYAASTHWICRPDRPDACDGDLDTTVIAPDGTKSIERWAPAADPPVDCFYVYPTVSRDENDNSDLVAGAEELEAVRVQAARFGSTCRVFAPVYRQVTVASVARAFGAALAPDPESLAQAIMNPGAASGTTPLDVAYADVVDAFRHYQAQDARGRGFILIGHSQGATLLSRLLRSEIAPDPVLRSRLVAAYTIGLPPGDRPDPAVTPPCTDAAATGCFVAYSAFVSSAPPASDSFLARSSDPGACMNPAAPAGGAATLHPYVSTATQPWIDPVEITTPFVALAGGLEATCVRGDIFTWLDVTVGRNAQGRPWPGLRSKLPPSWGLHSDEVQLTQGDLVSLAARQARAHTG